MKKYPVDHTKEVTPELAASLICIYNMHVNTYNLHETGNMLVRTKETPTELIMVPKVKEYGFLPFHIDFIIDGDSGYIVGARIKWPDAKPFEYTYTLRKKECTIMLLKTYSIYFKRSFNPYMESELCSSFCKSLLKDGDVKKVCTMYMAMYNVQGSEYYSHEI